MTASSRDYHDYVFRDGQLVAEFEAMYRNSEGVPWHQDEQSGWIDVRLTAEMLRDIGPFAEIHDLGCGLGYYLALLRNAVGADDSRGFGYDISSTACEKARALFPQFTFTQMDLTAVPIKSARGGVAAGRRLFVIRGTLWYVFPKIAGVVAAIAALLAAQDQLLVVQNFPPLEGSFIGKEVIPDHFALIRHFSSCFRPIRHLWYQDTLKSANDNWFIGLFSPRQS